MAVCNYPVFLSFRGSDTRDNLVKYLSDQLRRLGIAAFLDRDEIHYGESIGTTIVEAIERSNICIPVFSQDFASSPACLMEVAKMVRSQKKVLPIFFFVEPSVVRHQLRTYGESFAKHEHEKKYCVSTIKEWKDALKVIADKKGLEFKKASLETALEAALDAALDAALEASPGENGGINGPAFKKAALEAARIKIGGRFHDDLFSGFRELEDFISEIWKLLHKDEQDVTKDLVGLERDVPEMMRKLGFNYQDRQVVKEREITGRRVLTVWGLPGVGKTTLTKVLFNKISHLFEGCTFLYNVRDKFEQKREVSLQEKLIRDLKRGPCDKIGTPADGTKMIQNLFQEKKVLIVLDDVDDFGQIKPLAEELTWFGLGSTIILTAKTNDVYNVQKREEQNILNECEHEVKLMDENHAVELFCKCAFGPNHPLQDQEEISKKMVSAVGYLPFAIDFVGRSLNGKCEEEWNQTLGELMVNLTDKVEKMLLANYELLSHDAQEVFLDIACFFTGVEKTIPCYMWAARHQGRGVDELKKKSFLKIDGKKEFWMQGQLKFLGREIVKKENHDDPGERTRLWDYKDVKTILREKKGPYKAKALRVASNLKKVDGEVFHHLSKLRFLELDNVDINGNLQNLPPNLEWLDWRGPCEKSKLFAFNMDELVILSIHSNSVYLSLNDWQQLMEKAQSLEVLELKDCTWIHASLNFPASSLLKCLILEGCLSIKLDETTSNFENLVSLSLKHCEWVKHLPQALCSMTALKELHVDGTKIKRLHFEEESLPALEILSACDCKELREVTDSIGLLKNLRELALSGCNHLNTLPHVFRVFVLLQKMDLSQTSIKELPFRVEDCKKLQVLKMARTPVEGFPEAIKHLKELKELDFTNCGCLRGHCDITGLFSLKILRLTGTKISQVLPTDKVHRLHIFEFDNNVAEPEQIQEQSNAE